MLLSLKMESFSSPDFKIWCEFTNTIIRQERIMAVQQNKKSPSKRGMHRSHNALNVPGIAVESTTSALPVFTVAARCSKPKLKRNFTFQARARTYPAGLSFAKIFILD